ncbi:hypothetical protein K2X85_19080 [bacterium]|nr:hypothetical protein [bacterium]
MAARPGLIAKALPFHPEFDRSIDIVDGVWSPAFLSHFRPDGFLFHNRFVLSEINYGNGIIVSCGYTEAVDDYWRGHPVIKRLGWDTARLHRRPLPWLINIARRFARPVRYPTVALLAHSEEWRTLEKFPPRVMDQVKFVRGQFVRAGLRARLCTEKDIALDRSGEPHFDADGQRIDLLMFITIGTTFMDQPTLLSPGGSLAHFRGARMGDTWVLKPLAGLLIDKGALPLIGTLNSSRQAHDGFRFEVSPTEFPFQHDPTRYLRSQSDWVIKRAFDGKDTHVGVSSDTDRWNTAVRRSVSPQYVAQRYVSLPRADVPVLVDEKHLEWVPSRVELSPFIYDGAFGGAGARFAHDAEGLIMTDFPLGYGYSTVFCT